MCLIGLMIDPIFADSTKAEFPNIDQPDLCLKYSREDCAAFLKKNEATSSISCQDFVNKNRHSYFKAFSPFLENKPVVVDYVADQAIDTCRANRLLESRRKNGPKNGREVCDGAFGKTRVACVSQFVQVREKIRPAEALFVVGLIMDEAVQDRKSNELPPFFSAVEMLNAAVDAIEHVDLYPWTWTKDAVLSATVNKLRLTHIEVIRKLMATMHKRFGQEFMGIEMGIRADQNLKSDAKAFLVEKIESLHPRYKKRMDDFEREIERLKVIPVKKINQ